MVAGLRAGRQGWEVRPELFGIENALLDAADAIYDAIGWPGVVFLMAVESAAIPFPSEIIMPLAGWLLVKDAGHGFEWLFLAAFFGALGNTIGSLLAYYARALGGGALPPRHGRHAFVTHPARPPPAAGDPSSSAACRRWSAHSPAPPPASPG